MPDQDPYDAISRAQTDKTGVRIFNESKAQDGLIVIHSIVGNSIQVLDLTGEIVLEFNKVPVGYELYRPAKAAYNRNVYCILKSKIKFEDRAIACLDEYGGIVWKTCHHHFTHDFHIRHNRLILTVLRRDNFLFNGFRLSDNVICEMDIKGNILWEWSVLGNLDQLSIAEKVKSCTLEHKNDNPFHVNSIQIVDYPVIKDRFGEGAILVSSRNMNSVFLIGRNSGNVLFEYSENTLGQHHARILHEEFNSAGNLVIVDNGVNFFKGCSRPSRSHSRIIEIDTTNSNTVWTYESRADQPVFFSPIVGAQQRFPNGNTLVTEGYYGRIFEIDRNGEIVWDYVHPLTNTVEEHSKSKKKLFSTGLRQIYRAYKIDRDWMI